jgi:hypothetical protein
MSVINKHAPIKQKLLKNTSQFQWNDKELIIVERLRDHYYATYKKSQLIPDMGQYREYRVPINEPLKNERLLTSKQMRDFKNTKKFWSFYSTTIKIRSDKSTSSGLPDSIRQA